MATLDTAVEGQTWESVVEKLIARTIANQTRWDVGSDFHRPIDRDHLVGPIYYTHEATKTIACYRFRYQYYTGDGPDSFEWEEEVAIEFVDNGGEIEWKFPAVPSRFALLDAIQYQRSNAKSFADRFLSQD